VSCVLFALFQADLDGEAASVAEMKTHEGVREGVLMVRGEVKRKYVITRVQVHNIYLSFWNLILYLRPHLKYDFASVVILQGYPNSKS
jgi:hypothetical protein